MNQDFLNWSSVCGSIASIIGLAITIFVAFGIRSITRDFLFQARVPQLKKKITEHVKAISGLLGNFTANQAEIHLELKRCRANLNNLLPKLGKKEAADVKVIIRKIHSVRTASFWHRIQLQPLSESQYKERVEDIHSDLAELDEALSNLMQDNKWRPRQ